MVSYFIKIKRSLFENKEGVPDVLTNSYYPSLDGLRGIAILTVILRHVAFNKSWSHWIDGLVGVDIFFIISGFLITTLLLKEQVKTGRVSLKKFYIRRALRIVPVAYLYILILFVLNKIFLLNVPRTSFIASIFYLRNFPIATDWYTGHFWTLSIEEQFYLLAPVVLINNLNRYVKIVIMLFVIVPIVSFIAFHNIGIFYTVRWVHVITYIFLTLLDKGTIYILVGSFFSILMFKRILILEKLRRYYFLSTICFIVAIIFHYVSWLGLIPYLPSLLFALLMAFVIVLNLYENNFLTTIFRKPILVRLGVLSYSIYIWQQLFTNFFPWSGKFNYSDNIVLNLLALMIVACSSYYFFEIKFLELKKRFK